MQINFVGTGSIGAKEFSASTLIDNEILVDIPNGIIKKMKNDNINVMDIKVILITHLHGDHFLDIIFFMFDKFYRKSKEKVKIYCPINTRKTVNKIFDLAFPGDFDKIMNEVNIEFIEFTSLSKEEVLDKVYVTSKIVEHGNLKPAFGYIIEKDSKKIGFSGDTTICENVLDIVKESDLSILDMSLKDESNNAHMGVNDIEKICKSYKNKKIVATHMQSFARNIAQDKNIQNLIIPDDGMVIKI